MFVGPGTPVVVPNLTYGLYAAVSAAAGGVVTRVPPAGLAIDLGAVATAAIETDARLVWICDPNNPTGTLIEPDAWAAFLDRLPAGCVVIADETYIDFADPAVRVDRRRDVLEGRPVIAIRSFSKILGLAGLRVGFAISDPEVARLLDLVQEPFNVNRAALAAGIAGVADPGFVERAPRRGGRRARGPRRRARCGRPRRRTRRSRTSCSSTSASTTSRCARRSSAAASSCAAAPSSGCRASSA